MAIDITFTSIISGRQEALAQDSNQPFPIGKIPIEVLLRIFFFLTPEQQLTASKVCRQWAIGVFCNQKNNLALDSAKSLSGMQIDGVAPDFLKEARFYYHMNIKMVQIFANNLRRFDIDPSPFPIALFTPATLPKAIELDRQKTINEHKNNLALIRFHTILHIMGILPAIASGKPSSMAKQIRLMLTTTENAVVKGIKELKIIPEGLESDFTIPNEISLFTSLETLNISGERIGEPNAAAFIPQASLYLPTALGSIPGLVNLEIAFFKNIGEIPNLPKLTSIYFRGCRNLTHLPTGLERLKKLENLQINGCNALEEIADNIGMISSLQSLKITLCSNLSQLSLKISTLDQLRKFEIFACSKLYNNRKNEDMVLLFKKIMLLPHMKNFHFFDQKYMKEHLLTESKGNL